MQRRLVLGTARPEDRGGRYSRSRAKGGETSKRKKGEAIGKKAENVDPVSGVPTTGGGKSSRRKGRSSGEELEKRKPGCGKGLDL